jgi:hypothetical protein
MSCRLFANHTHSKPKANWFTCAWPWLSEQQCLFDPICLFILSIPCFLHWLLLICCCFCFFRRTHSIWMFTDLLVALFDTCFFVLGILLVDIDINIVHLIVCILSKTRTHLFNCAAMNAQFGANRITAPSSWVQKIHLVCVQTVFETISCFNFSLFSRSKRFRFYVFFLNILEVDWEVCLQVHKYRLFIFPKP